MIYPSANKYISYNIILSWIYSKGKIKVKVIHFELILFSVLNHSVNHLKWKKLAISFSSYTLPGTGNIYLYICGVVKLFLCCWFCTSHNHPLPYFVIKKKRGKFTLHFFALYSLFNFRNEITNRLFKFHGK